MLGTTNSSSLPQTSIKDLNISINGTSKLTYNGTESKSLDISLASIGAAAASHNHDSVYAAKSHTHSYLPLSGGIMTVGIETRTVSTMTVYDNVVAYSNDTPDIAGIIKITLPTAFSSTMLKIYVSIYNYLADTSTDIVISAYPYGDKSWHQLTAYCSNINIVGSIRLAYDGSKCCVLLGTTKSRWAYPKVVVTKVIAGFNTHTSFRTGWTISIVSSESGLTNMCEPIPINRGLNATLFSGYNTSNFMLALRPSDSSNYHAMAPGGNQNLWVRTSSLGIIPYQAGTVTTGTCSLGTSSWYFAAAYATNVYGYNFYQNGGSGSISAIQSSAPNTKMLWTY